MASKAEASSAIARLRLEQLHHGMVVELERHMVPDQDAENAVVPVDSEVEDYPEVLEAVRLVTQTRETIKHLKSDLEKRDQTINERAELIAHLEAENGRLTRDIVTLRAQLDADQRRLEEAESQISVQEEELEARSRERDILSQQMRHVIDVITSSLTPPTR